MSLEELIFQAPVHSKWENEILLKFPNGKDIEKTIIEMILSLASFGEYCPDNSLRGYGLDKLINSPRYKVVKIVVKGKTVKVT